MSRLVEQKRTETVDVLVQYDSGDLDEQGALDAIERIWT